MAAKGREEQAHDWAIRLRDRQEFRRIVPAELDQRDAIDSRDLRTAWPRSSLGRSPYDDRRDEVAGARGVVVEPTDDRRRQQGHAQFLGQFTQRSPLDALIRIDPPARQRQLAAMSAEPRRSGSQEE